MGNAALAVVVASEPRQFKTVNGALKWFRDERARRLVRGRDAAGARGCKTREAVEAANLAFGLIAACLKPETGKNAVLTAAAIRQLLEWLCAERSMVHIADTLGLSEHVASKWLGRLEWAMAQKMRGYRLLSARGAEAPA